MDFAFHPSAPPRVLVMVSKLDHCLHDLIYRWKAGNLAAELVAVISINIHHSFLPGFKGAKPYHQAHARGVKHIGATAHYVTADLDEGPIIEQEVIRVDHRLGPQQLATVGRDAETLALARAVRWHAEKRVLLSGHRTIVFP